MLTRNTPPFSFQDESGKWRGLSIDLWRRIAEAQGLQYDIEEATSLSELFASLESGEADLAVAGLTVTSEREKSVDFTHPFLFSSIGIISRKADYSPWKNVVRRFISVEFLIALFSLLVILFCSGAALYLFERKHNPQQFNSNPIRGLGDALWWSAVTMTTVGYGDKAPVSLGGRLVALVWMFLSVIILSSFTASIVSSLALQEPPPTIRSLEQITPGNVITVPDSTADALLLSHNLSPAYAQTPEEAVAAVLDGTYEAMVYDHPVLDFLARSDRDLLVLRPLARQRQEYAFALPPDSSLREPINTGLIDMTRGSEWDAIRKRYLADESQ